MTNKQIIISGLGILAVFAVTLLGIMYLMQSKKADAVSALDTIGGRSCTASSSYFSLAANTGRQILGTSTPRIWAKIEATSTPGAVTFQYVGLNQPDPSSYLGPMIKSASSSETLIDYSTALSHSGRVWARSKDSIGAIMVTECILN